MALSSLEKGKRGRIFPIINGLLLSLLAFICIVPMINILAISLSSSAAATAGLVKLWPIDFTFKSYEFVMKREAFWTSMGVTMIRCLLGVSLNMILCIITAYPLSKENRQFKMRTLYAWTFFLTMLINPGLIPWYMTINNLKLTGTIWALILPGAVPVFNIVLLLNFFRGIPQELEEAAFVDGASHWRVLFQIFVPISLPSIATVALFSLVHHWNSWFDGIILMNKPIQYPLQSYLHTVIIQRDLSLVGSSDWQSIAQVSDRTVKSAQIFLSALPIIAAYPFFQRYFVKGLVLGSVKG
ncbi:MAG: carbohydrate ABC transporter permease [Clostridiales bacterium]|nr:carbohydrate ABC transporter permease [Clostridiales bacterium]